MKNLRFFIIVVGLIISACNQNSNSKVSSENDSLTDKEEIQNLIRKTLSWADDQSSLELIPAIADDSDSIYIGFDFDKVKLNIEQFEKTGFFASEFIDNYHQIILALDKKIKNKEYYDWLVGDMPSFNFMAEANPWCYCQEIPDDPWDLVEITVVELNENQGELTWTWGNVDWGDKGYNFKVIKEDGKWKISYMKGFDYDESIEGW